MVVWMTFCIILRNPNGNRYVLYLIWNGNEWNWNYNWLDNDWNADNLSAGVATLLFPSFFYGRGWVLFCDWCDLLCKLTIPTTEIATDFV